MNRLRSASVADPVPFASGRDADVFILDRQRVLRRYRAGGDVSAEAAVMAYVRRLGFPAPLVYQARGTDLIMERLDGRTMLAALTAGTLEIPKAARMLAELHHRLHNLPALANTGGAIRIVHLDLHPDNVMLTSQGPVLIDWRNATHGPPDLDLAVSAVILAQAAVDPTQPMARPAKQLLEEFMRHAGGDPESMVEEAIAMRRANPTMTTHETGLLDAAAALISQR